MMTSPRSGAPFQSGPAAEATRQTDSFVVQRAGRGLWTWLPLSLSAAILLGGWQITLEPFHSPGIISLQAAEPSPVKAVNATSGAEANASTDPTLTGIAFVGGPVVDGEHENNPGAYHWRDGYVYPKGATNNKWERTHSAPRPGRNLFSLRPARPDGTLTQLTFLKTGNVYDPEPSFDGQKILFSMRKDGEDWYHLFEIQIDGTGLRQLTDGPFNDISGVYLPDGRIVFCSDRSGVLDEYHEERSEFLYRMNPDGTGIEQITFVPGIYFEPTVLKNGLILCSFWDAFHISVPPFIKHETYLITLRPDGTDERPFFGAGQYKFYNRTRHSAIGLTRPGEMPDGRILVQSELGPSLYDPNLGIDLATALAPIFPGTASVQTGGTTHMIHLSPTGTRSSPYPLPDGRFLMAATLPGSRDIGLYTVDPNSRAMSLVFDRTNLSEWDAVPIGMTRSKPAALPDQVRNTTDQLSAQQKTAQFIVIAGRDSDTPERKLLNERARFVRVLQAEYTELAVSSHTSLETRILGTVPLQPDGSVVFEAPAETPLFLETLDARGNRLVLQAGYMAARAGEVKSCAGCHTAVSGAVANSQNRALKFSIPKVARDSTDLSYRRNEPEEYRRQAAIGDAAQSRAWMNSTDPQQIWQGLDLLSYSPDEVQTADRVRMAALLSHAEPIVRQRAAFALAMVGSADQIPALISRLEDADWQTRFFVAMALEAITGEQLDLKVDLDLTAATWNRWWKETGSVPQFLTRLVARGAAYQSSPLGEVSAADQFARDAWLDAVARLDWLTDVSHQAQSQAAITQCRNLVLPWLKKTPPDPIVARTMGWLRDPRAVPYLTPWMIGGANPRSDEAVPDSDDALEREVKGLAVAKEVSIALGRIGGESAITALWDAARKAIPNPRPFPSRHYQTGPRPEEYTYLRALILAGAKPTLDEVPLLIGLMPSTFGEKPRFEDRTKPLPSQRAKLARILLERADLKRPILKVALDVLSEQADPQSPLYQKLLAGSNNDRPYSEHGHPFPVLKAIESEQALQYINCLAEPADQIPEALIAAQLLSTNHRSRIEAATILRRLGIKETATLDRLKSLIAKPYEFSEIWSIGKGCFDLRFREKGYYAIALAAHEPDCQTLLAFTDPHKMYRDIRLGLALGAGDRDSADEGVTALLKKLADDPVFTVYRNVENSRIRLQDREHLAGRNWQLPLPGYRPSLQGGSTAREYAFADRTADPVGLPGKIVGTVERAEQLPALWQALVEPTAYANVSNTFARNAERMRLMDARQLERSLLGAVSLQAPITPEIDAAVRGAINSPYPFAHYLASRWVAERRAEAFGDLLAERLAAFVKEADTVGFYWSAEALGRLRNRSALDKLLPYATSARFDRVYGSPGMAYGFAAARGIGMLSTSAEDPVIAGLLKDANPWMVAGVLEGLSLAQVPRTEQLLDRLSADAGSGFLEEELRFGRSLLARPGSDSKPQ